MAIRRVRSGSFTTINNNVFNDDRLSAEALGVLAYLLTKPADWQTMPTELANRFGCGRNRIYRILKDLIEVGYITRSQDRNPATRSFEGANYDVTDLLDVGPRTQNGDTAQKPDTGNPHPQNGALLNTERTKDRKDSRPAKKQDAPYSEEFENEVWKPYPRKAGTSKKKGWDMFRMLTPELQQRVKVAIPIYAEMMRREGRPEDKIKHLQFWLSERVYETIAAPAAGGSATPVTDWYKTATRGQWATVLLTWATAGSFKDGWRKAWGPAPGEPGCGVPEDMVLEHNIKHRGHLFSPEDYEAMKVRLSQLRDGGSAGSAAV